MSVFISPSLTLAVMLDGILHLWEIWTLVSRLIDGNVVKLAFFH